MNTCVCVCIHHNNKSLTIYIICDGINFESFDFKMEYTYIYKR